MVSDTTWASRTTLITGIGGFLGSALAKALLEAGATIVGILRDATAIPLLEIRGIADRLNLVRGSITESGLVERAVNEYEVDTVFHLAAQALVRVANRSPVSTFESNIAGTWQVLEAVRALPSVERVVVASSDKAYGVQPVLPYTEHSALAASYPYDASKACADILARSYAVSFGLPVGVLRCANIYGAGDLNWSRLIPGTIRSALLGEAPVIRSDGTPERDYLYLDDAVDAYLRLADHLPDARGEAFNAGTGKAVSVLKLVKQILTAVGTDLSPQILGEANREIDRQFLDSTKANKLLEWMPKTDLEEGLQKTVEWYRSFLQETGQTAGAFAESMH
jgi:CDP-glucose 4,6-dehydratase